jgi:hypothetical protein
MAIVLKDLVDAVGNYIANRVQVSITAPDPSTGDEINKNEEFTFAVKVTNPAAVDSIRLKNIRYAVDSQNPASVDLIVPTDPGLVARSGDHATDPILQPGTRVKFMYIFPSDERNVLEEGGETEAITLRGRAISSPANTTIRFRVLADPDLDFLFPKDRSTKAVSVPLSIKE